MRVRARVRVLGCEWRTGGGGSMELHVVSIPNTFGTVGGWGRPAGSCNYLRRTVPHRAQRGPRDLRSTKLGSATWIRATGS